MRAKADRWVEGLVDLLLAGACAAG